MPSESGPSNTAPQYKPLESLKETFKQRLDTILYKQLTVENIEAFADKALSETVALTDDILKEYKNNQTLFHVNILPVNTQEQENEAFAVLGLPNIQNILQKIIEVKEEIYFLKKYAEENTENTGVVNTPPQPDYPTEIKEGTGGFEKRIFPRLLTLLYILKHDFNILPKPANMKKGIVTPNIIRKTPYTRVEIPALERAVYICDEEGNVSYIFDTKKLTEQG
jgi:hypothetical protein